MPSFMLIDDFLHYMKYEKGYSSHTFVSYESDLFQFVDFVESRGETFDPETLDARLVREWLVEMMENGQMIVSLLIVILDIILIKQRIFVLKINVLTFQKYHLKRMMIMIHKEKRFI